MWNTPTEEQLNRLIPVNLYGGEHIPLKEKIIYAHFFIASADWFCCEWDKNDLLFGFCCLGDLQSAEWGVVSFNELKSLRVDWMEVDFDLYWQIRLATKVDLIRQAHNWLPPLPVNEVSTRRETTT